MGNANILILFRFDFDHFPGAQLESSEKIPDSWFFPLDFILIITRFHDSRQFLATIKIMAPNRDSFFSFSKN